MTVRYLDLDLMINGMMDLFLLLLTARLLHIPSSVSRLLGGVILGELPVILAAYSPASLLLTLSKVLTPFLMVWVSYVPVSRQAYIKRLSMFWILSAGLGGMVYALWGWIQFDGLTSSSFRWGVRNFWIVPLGILLWWGGQTLWIRWLSLTMQLKPMVYEVLIDFGADCEPIKVKALLDTGNRLHDPLTGAPVLLLEEEIAATALPGDLQPILEAPWRELKDPWPWLWQTDPSWIKTFLFIPYQSVGQRSWLLGIRPQHVFLSVPPEMMEIRATLALVHQSLSPDGAFQALLHPEHIQGSGG